MAQGTNRELRQLIRCFVDGISLRPADSDAPKTNEPAAHEITLNLKATPALFAERFGAGARSVAIYTGLSAWLVRRYRLARNGRRFDVR